MKRAIGDEQKLQRRLDIVARAAELLTTRDFEAVTLTEVAVGLGLVKGTLYRYFATKEELVLEVLEHELALWLAALTRDLAPPPQKDAASLAAVLAGTLAKRPLLIRLFSIVHVQLEKNLALDRLVAFKQTTARVLAQGAALLESAWPPLAKKGVDAVLALYELAIGVGHLTDRSPVVERALATPGLEVFCLDFNTQLKKSLEWMLLGLAS